MSMTKRLIDSLPQEEQDAILGPIYHGPDCPDCNELAERGDCVFDENGDAIQIVDAVAELT